MKVKELKLTIDLIPSPLWFSSLYAILKSYGLLDKWKEIKSCVFRKEGFKCFICGKGGYLELHESWDYDDINHIQKLVGIHHLCSLCHKVKHIGFWCYTNEGLNQLSCLGLKERDLINHFCRVNNCSKEDYKTHKDKVFKVFNDRNKYEWIQDFSLVLKGFKVE